MTDINKDVQRVLEALPYTVTFSHPERFNKLPVISFYDIHTGGSFSADNSMQIYTGRVVVDVWAKDPAKAGMISSEITKAMNAGGWWCELNRFADKTDGIYHRTMRFGKNFISESEEL